MLPQQLLLFNATAFPSKTSLPQACTDALSRSVRCDPVLLLYATSRYSGVIDESILDQQLCSTDCTSSLNAYHDAVTAACPAGSDVMNGFPATHTGDFLLAYQSMVCIRDQMTKEYCVNQLANTTVPVDFAALEDLPKELLCSDCVVAMMQEAQSSGFSSYDAESAQSWASIQTSCNMSGLFPTDVPTGAHMSKFVEFGSGSGWQPTAKSVNSSSALLCTSGTAYTVEAASSVLEISNNLNVSTSALRLLNGMDDDCSKLKTGEAICLPPSCKTFSARAGDTCFSVLSGQSLTWSQLLAYNPGLQRDCSGLVAGEQICLSGAQAN